MMKFCPKCKEEKSLSDFGKDRYKKSGLTSRCKTCMAATSRNYREANPDKAKQIAKDYRVRNLDKERERYRRYNKENPQVRAAHAAKRRAYHKGATPVWLTEDQKSDIKSMYSLAKKLGEVFNIEYHVDHIVPLAGKDVCGLHVPWNLQILCASLNFAKGNKHHDYETLRGGC